MKKGRVAAVFDADSHQAVQFTTADVAPRRKILSLLNPSL